MKSFEYFGPRTVKEALSILQEHGPGGKVLAGGTDLMVQMKERGIRPGYVVGLSRVQELRGIEEMAEGGLRIRAATSAYDTEFHPNVRTNYPILVQGAELIGSRQIQALGTIGGNLCNAAPSADCAPPLIALDAIARIVGPNSDREVPMDGFFQGPGLTALEPGELLSELIVPPPPSRSAGYYVRHTPRSEMDISVVGVGVVLGLDDVGRTVEHVRIVLGAVAPTPIRARQAEASLVGQAVTVERLEQAARIAASEARPISDVRGSATFRRALVHALALKTLSHAWRQATA
jgi:carbon-monoxide dehydrogenase medium subunit